MAHSSPAGLAERLETSISGAWVAVLGTALMLGSVFFNRFGSLHIELWTYVPYHLGPGSIFKKIFDSTTLESGTYYQGRELSYLVDHLDVLAMAETVRWGFPCFVSITHLLLSVLIGCLLWRFCAFQLDLGRLTGLLLALLFWTAPFVFIHAIFRSAKVGAAFCLVWLARDLYRRLALPNRLPEGPLRIRPLLPIFLPTLLASLFDRQGLFLVGVLLLLALLNGLATRNRDALRAAGAMGAAMALNLIYFQFCAPALTSAFFGYRPDPGFNAMPWGTLWAERAKYLGGGVELLVDTFRFLLGSVPVPAAAALLAALFAGAAAIDVKSRRAAGSIPGLFFASSLLAAALAVLMFAGMYLKHPPVFWPDVRRLYYWLPTSGLILMGIALLLDRLIALRLLSRGWLQLVLAALVLGSLGSLPGHRRVVDRGSLRDVLAFSVKLRAALVHVREPAYPVPAEIESNRAYQALRAFALNEPVRN